MEWTRQLASSGIVVSARDIRVFDGDDEKEEEESSLALVLLEEPLRGISARKVQNKRLGEREERERERQGALIHQILFPLSKQKTNLYCCTFSC